MKPHRRIAEPHIPCFQRAPGLQSLTVAGGYRATIACVFSNALFGALGFAFFGAETDSVVLNNLGQVLIESNLI